MPQVSDLTLAKQGWLLRKSDGSTPTLSGIIGRDRYLTPNGNQLHVFLDVPLAELLNDSGVPESVPCLYTFESTICFSPFQYEVAMDRSVQLIKLTSDDATTDLAGMIDIRPRHVEFGLTPMTNRVVELVRLLNRGVDLTAEEECEFAQLTQCCSKIGPGIEPYADVFSQLFGHETFLHQHPDRPCCEKCLRPMPFLAALAGNERLGTTYIPDSGHVVFHFCASCNVVDCAHYA